MALIRMAGKEMQPVFKTNITKQKKLFSKSNNYIVITKEDVRGKQKTQILCQYLQFDSSLLCIFPYQAFFLLK